MDVNFSFVDWKAEHSAAGDPAERVKEGSAQPALGEWKRRRRILIVGVRRPGYKSIAFRKAWCVMVSWAVFGGLLLITADPFLVFASNVFAILGLRSLYFVLAGMIRRFADLKVSLALVLALVGTKMLAAHWLRHWIGAGIDFYLLSLAGLILAAGVLASLWATRPMNARTAIVPEVP